MGASLNEIKPHRDTGYVAFILIIKLHNWPTDLSSEKPVKINWPGEATLIWQRLGSKWVKMTHWAGIKWQSVVRRNKLAPATVKLPWLCEAFLFPASTFQRYYMWRAVNWYSFWWWGTKKEIMPGNQQNANTAVSNMCFLSICSNYDIWSLFLLYSSKCQNKQFHTRGASISTFRRQLRWQSCLEIVVLIELLRSTSSVRTTSIWMPCWEKAFTLDSSCPEHTVITVGRAIWDRVSWCKNKGNGWSLIARVSEHAHCSWRYLPVLLFFSWRHEHRQNLLQSLYSAL